MKRDHRSVTFNATEDDMGEYYFLLELQSQEGLSTSYLWQVVVIGKHIEDIAAENAKKFKYHYLYWMPNGEVVNVQMPECRIVEALSDGTVYILLNEPLPEFTVSP